MLCDMNKQIFTVVQDQVPWSFDTTDEALQPDAERLVVAMTTGHVIAYYLLTVWEV